MLPIINIHGHLHHSNGQTGSAVCVISLDQAYQQAAEFEAFCLKINAEYDEKNINELAIIETGYLKRHYFRLDAQYSSNEEADEAALKFGEEWVKNQQLSLKQLKPTVKILSWLQILNEQKSAEDKPFQEYLSMIQKDYEMDKVFKNHADRIANKYAEKLAVRYNPNGEKKLELACLQAAKNYLLEEATVIFKLVQRGFTCQLYPGNANAAVKYIHKKYFGKNNPLPWIRYAIKHPDGVTPRLKTSASHFFQSESNQSNPCEDIKKRIKLLFNELPAEERFLLGKELYLENNMEMQSLKK